jgi:hypothetical protein
MVFDARFLSFDHEMFVLSMHAHDLASGLDDVHSPFDVLILGQKYTPGGRGHKALNPTTNRDAGGWMRPYLQIARNPPSFPKAILSCHQVLSEIDGEGIKPQEAQVIHQ